jgi:hypothetical protein
MSYEDYEWILYVSSYRNELICRTKYKDHWKPFDRKKPPKFMICGEIGIDDKRKLIAVVGSVAHLQPTYT